MTAGEGAGMAMCLHSLLTDELLPDGLPDEFGHWEAAPPSFCLDLSLQVRLEIDSGAMHAYMLAYMSHDSDAIFIDVPRPLRKNRQPDIFFIELAARTLRACLDPVT